MKYIDRAQSLLPLGYLYLVVLGILKETVVFYQLGINILKYSTVMDILISPIAVMTSHPIVFIVMMLVSYYPFLIRNLFMKHSEKKWVRQFFAIKKIKSEMPEEEAVEYADSLFLRSFMALFFSIFLGFALMEGWSVSKDIHSGQLEYKHKIYYNTGDAEEVSLIDSNIEYYFYVPKGSKNIRITPTGAIKSIEIIDNKALK